MSKSKNYSNLSSIIILLLFFITANHFLVMLTFVFSIPLLPFIFLISLAISLVVQFFIIKEEVTLKTLIFYLVVSVGLIIASTLFGLFYFDFSWDGQWYHQEAIFAIADGWNPLKNPLQIFEDHNNNSIRHFPKSSWYYAAAFYSVTGLIEGGKSINIILFFAALIMVYLTSKEYNLSKFYSILLSFGVCLNPVVWSEITTFLVDGNLYFLLLIYLCSVLHYLSTPNKLSLVIGGLAVLLLCNIKFTGLAFYLIFAFFIFIYIVICRRDVIFKFTFYHFLVTLFGVGVFGYNPYITNTIERFQPFYPIIGSAKFPTELDNGFDGNEFWETPANMKGEPTLLRFFYAHFSKPGNAPYTQPNAVLSLPFKANFEEWNAYNFHETRVAGFGPFYSGIFVLSLCLLLVIFIKDKTVRWFCILFYAAVFTSLVLSKHFWWPRFAPHIWLIPIVPIFLSIRRNDLHSLYKVLGKVLLILLLVNGLIVLVVHMKWETQSSITLQEQLNKLQKLERPIQLSWGWFKRATVEKMEKNKIKYISIPYDTLSKKPHQELKSVVESYPGSVLYKVE